MYTSLCEITEKLFFRSPAIRYCFVLSFLNGYLVFQLFMREFTPSSDEEDIPINLLEQHRELKRIIAQSAFKATRPTVLLHFL